jgi:hypothetical protein
MSRVPRFSSIQEEKMEHTDVPVEMIIVGGAAIAFFSLTALIMAVTM